MRTAQQLSCGGVCRAGIRRILGQRADSNGCGRLATGRPSRCANQLDGGAMACALRESSRPKRHGRTPSDFPCDDRRSSANQPLLHCGDASEFEQRLIRQRSIRSHVPLKKLWVL